MDTKLSVIVPTRNSESHISSQLRSLVANIEEAGIEIAEILVVDDASNDETVRILGELRNTDPRIRLVIHTAQRGLQLAVSTGLDLARCDFALICEDDFVYGTSAIQQVTLPVLSGDLDACIGCSDVGGRNLSSKVFWNLLRIATSGQVQNRELMFRCIGPAMLREIRAYRDVTRTITGLMIEIGLNVARIRVSGVSTGIRKSGNRVFDRLKLFVEIYITLSNRPLFSLVYFSLFLISGFLGVGLWGIAQVISGGDVTTLAWILFLSATLLVCSIVTSLSWITIQMLTVILREVRRRPMTSYRVVEEQ